MEEHLFGIIPESEREKVMNAFQILEEDKLDQAYKLFTILNSNKFSSKTQAFAQYGLGITYNKKGSQDNPNIEDIETSINYLQSSLKTLEHSDAYLILGYSFQQKFAYLSEKTGQTIGQYPKLIELLDQSISAFKDAEALNIYYGPKLEESIERLTKNKRDLEKILEKSKSLLN